MSPSTSGTCAVELEHQALHMEDLVIWITRDEHGFSDEKVLYIRSKHLNIWVTNGNAKIDEKDSRKIQGKLSQSIFRAITGQI